MSEPIRIVSATRVSEENFESSTLLGKSLAVLRRIADFETSIAFDNSEGLPTIYNRALDDAKDHPAILVFVHDDVYIADTLWIEEIRRCLAAIDVVGIVGNRRRTPRQASWAFAGEPDARGQYGWDEPEWLSGTIGYDQLPGKFSIMGPPHMPCRLLDGLMLAARATAKLHDCGLMFDPRFQFHFYDMDFCRQAELKNLKMGTGAIKVIHPSHGAVGSPEWTASYQLYLQKYGS